MDSLLDVQAREPPRRQAAHQRDLRPQTRGLSLAEVLRKLTANGEPDCSVIDTQLRGIWPAAVVLKEAAPAVLHGTWLLSVLGGRRGSRS